ncbi:MAG: GNAT family N-acetyltransferase [Mesorhizobium sp. SCN 65-20]|nr:MAG: GNAT family N-acetyltransferase [Mesorhizobium sp. SCN 65-20]
MAGQVTIRRAEKRDAAELAILVDLSSHGFASWLWHGSVVRGEVETALECGRCQLRSDDETGGWKDASFAEVDGEVAGAVIGYSIDTSIGDVEADHPVLHPLIDLQKKVIGSWFIDSLGVYRHHRGIGLGRQLLDHELERAAGRTASLITESTNEVALGLYRSSGFVEVERMESVPLSADGKTHDWVLLTRSAT